MTFCYKLKLPADTSRKERIANKYLEPDEVTTLLNAMAIPDWFLLTKVLILSGLRISKAIALTADDIDDKYIHVTKTYDTVNRIVTDPKTATSTRAVYIQPELASLLREIRRNELEKQILHNRKANSYFQVWTEAISIMTPTVSILQIHPRTTSAGILHHMH